MRLNQTMAEGIQILQVAVLDETEGNAMASVAAADYLISFRDSVSLPDDWKEKLTAFYEKDKIPVIKKTKKGEREIDLKETIYQLEIREDQVYMLLDAGSGSNMKPGFVLETLCTAENISLPEYPFRVRRLETYKRTGEGRLVPLIP